MKKIFLSGGSGFIGRNILEQIGHKFEFFSPTHSELDLLDEKKVRDYFKKHNFDLVIHSANRGGSRKETHFTDVVSSNLRIFLNLISCKENFKRMIFLGSGAEYDKRRDIIDIREDQFGEFVPIDDYGFYKYTCSNFIKNLDYIVNLRIFGLFGKYEDSDVRFISSAINNVLLSQPITINQNALFDYVYVDDFVRIIEHFIENEPKEKFYNIGTGEKVDLLTLAKLVDEISGKNLGIEIKNDGMNKEYTCDNSVLSNELGDFKFTELKKAIRELFLWYRSKNKS